MAIARYRVTLSILAVAAWMLIQIVLGRALPSPEATTSLMDTAATMVRALSERVAINILAAIVGLAIIALLLRWNDLGFNRPRPWRSLWLLWVPGLYLVLFYAAGLAVGLPPLPVLGILLINTILVGISEELAFRGVLFRGLRSRLGMWPSVLISSALFGAVHVLNALTTGNLLAAGVQAVAAMMTGVALVAIVIRTGSIIPAIVVHVLWDLGGLITLYATVNQPDAVAAAGGGTTPEMTPLLYVVPLLFNLPNFLYALFLLRRKRTGPQSEPVPADALPVAATQG